MAIIEAALRVFGDHGYERASTRQIAGEAGVNPPALQYYFDSKEGLHTACARLIALRYSGAMADAFAAANRISVDDRPGAVDALCGILDVLATFIFETLQVEGWAKFLARGEGEGGEPADAVLRPLGEQLHAHAIRLVGIATARAPGDPLSKLQAIALLGQLSIFHLSGASALATLGWTDFRGGRLDVLKAAVTAQTRAALRICRADAGAPA